MSSTSTADTPTDRVPTAKRRRKKSLGWRSATPLRGLAPLLVLIIAWQIFGTDDSAYFPRPSTWADALLRLNEYGTLLPSLGASLRSLLLSLLTATVIGAVLGVIVGASRFLDRALSPTLEFFRATPSSAMVPIGVLLLGYTQTMQTSLTALAALWPILLNTRSAMRELNPVLLDVATVFGMSWRRRITTIIMPSVSTAILLGVRVGAPVAIIVTLLVEILTGVPGLGALLAQSQQEYNSAATFGLLVLIGIIALLFNMVIGAMESFFTRHHPRA